MIFGMAPPLAPRLLPIKSANQRETHLFLMHVMFTVIVTKQNDVSICAYSPSLHIDQSVDGLPYAPDFSSETTTSCFLLSPLCCPLFHCL